jgi:tripartite ATP-independent transporter DctP family solute receptor
MVAKLSRRAVLGQAAAVVAAPTVLGSRAWAAAEFRFKLATTILADQPINEYARRAAAAVLAESNGRVAIQVFPGYQLGSSTSVMSAVREGSIEMATFSGAIYANVLPVSSLYNLAFIFKDYDAIWRTMDGKCGDLLRSRIEATGLHPLSKIWNLGFRQITTSTKPIKTVDDLKGVKIRVAQAPLILACFKQLGASPVALNFDELFTALQTKVADGQENDLFQILKGGLYEVQKYCALTSHIFDGYYFLVNGQIWKDLPDDMKTLVATKFDEAAVQQRQALIDALGPAQTELAAKGLIFNDVDREEFKAALRKLGYYAEWKKTFGPDVWNLLEESVGPLA